MTLRTRFWLVSLGLVVSALLLFLIFVSNVLTPHIAERVVRLDEENRMLRLAREFAALDSQEIENELVRRSLTNISLLPKGSVDPKGVFVTLPGSDFAFVSKRPLTVNEARKALTFSSPRQLALLTFALLVLYFIATQLAGFVIRPVHRLTKAVQALAEGERGVAVPIPAETELAELARSFNQMATDLQARETELKQALQAKERIFATTSHELRTPLTVILGYCQMLQDGLKGPLNEEQSQVVGVIHRNAGGLLRQVEALLTLSQLRARSLPFERERVDLGQLVEQAVDGLAGLAENKGLTLETALNADHLEVLIDPRVGEQITSNLVANAIKYTCQGHVRVALEKRGGEARVVVSDTGPGIAADFRPSLFQEFSRGPETDGIEGNGLGLALSRQLAENMGGSVELLQTGPGGSSFCWSHPVEVGDA